MTAVRGYQSKDKEALRKILVETSRLPVDTQNDIRYLELLYNDYYTEVEPENCFVSVDENDNATGYIICASDYKRFQKLFRKFYLPEIRELGVKYYINAVMDIAGHFLYARKYPAHLHINIQNVGQGKGTGSKLMHELKAHLKQQGIKGLMLSCAEDNTGAIRFYKKNGFRVLSTIGGGCVMAIEL